MIFPNIVVEPVLQVDDRTRLNASKSYVSKGSDAILSVEIEPDTGLGFVDVTGSTSRDWFLDWQYDTAGAKTVTTRVTIDDLANTQETKTAIIDVLTAAEDALFSTDSDLLQFEEEILKFVPEGRNSFLNVHRKMQSLILDELDERGVQNRDGTRITKDQIVDVKEVNSWSTFGVLHLIYMDLYNSTEDVFFQKAQDYKSKKNFHRDDAFIRLDLNRDGQTGFSEQVGVRTGNLIRR